MKFVARRILGLFGATLFLGCGNGDDNSVPVAPATSSISCATSRVSAPASPSQSTATVPITIGPAQGETRFSVPVKVGSTTLTALLDTGSSGLRVLQSKLKSGDATLTCVHATETFNGGLSLQGVRGYAPVTLGGATTSNPIPIMVVTSACSGSPCESVALDDTVIYGFDAILGIGLRGAPTGIRSPIAAMSGHPAYSISTNGGTGTLQIGLQAPDFAMIGQVFQLPRETLGAPGDAGAGDDAGGPVCEDDAGPPPSVTEAVPAWDDTRIMACLRDTTANESWCEGALLDTGEPTVYVETLDDGPYWLPWGDDIEMILEGPNGCVFDEYPVTAGSPPSNEIEIRQVNTSEPYINLSQLAFVRYDVVFDPEQGVIGLTKR